MASRRRVDDSDESTEATALDIRPLSRPARPGEGVVPRVPAPRAPLHDSSDEHEDATEFLARPASAIAPRSSAGSLEARGNRRAVPLDEDDIPSSISRGGAPAPRPLPHRPIEATNGHSTTAPVPQVLRLRVDDDESSTGEHGPHAAIVDVDDDSERTLPPDRLQVLRPAMKPIAPVVPVAQTPPTRPPRPATMVDVVDDETQAPDEHSESAEPPLASAPAARAMPDEPRARAARTLDEPADGVLVVEAPADASVTVNGVERGRGVVRVLELDRHARHAVRIHCPGHVPWSGSVSLEGRPAAKIKPSLKPRAR